MRKYCLPLLLVAPMSFADSIRLADGTECRFDVDKSAFEASVEVSDGYQDYEYGHYDFQNRDEKAVSVSFTYKFGAPERLDCHRLYNMELERRELELKLMRKKLEIMDKAQDIDW